MSRAWSVIRESVGLLKGAPWRTGGAALVAFGVCLSVLATTGRAAATERRVLAQLDQAGSRMVELTWSAPGAGFDPAVLDRVRRLDGVEWALGFGKAIDMRVEGVGGGKPAPVKAVVGPWPKDQLRQTMGRSPNSGEALVSPKAAANLGLAVASGSLAAATGPSSQFLPRRAVVGQFVPGPALDHLDGFVLVKADLADTAGIWSVMALAKRVIDVPVLAQSMKAIAGAADREAVKVKTTDNLVKLDSALKGEMRASARVLGLGALAAGGGFAALALALAVGARRRDLGRQRALGASRSMVVTLVMLQGALPAVVGALLGTAVGLLVLRTWVGALPDLGFSVAVPALTVLAVLAGSIPAALTAAWRDPVAVLRVP